MEPAEFAEYLRAERERRRISLDQVSDETKIAHRHLAALERGDVRNWPGGMYRRAMMRAYAESIGVDREFALEQFDRAFEEPAAEPEAPETGPQPHSSTKQARRNQPLIMAIGLTAVVAALATMLWPGESANVPADTAVVVAAAPSTTPAVSAPVERVEAAKPTATPPPTVNVRPPASEGRLVIESQPAGARVTVNGIGWGETPVTIRHLEFGEKRVRLTLQGYFSVERSVGLLPERPAATVRTTLTPRE